MHTPPFFDRSEDNSRSFCRDPDASNSIPPRVHLSQGGPVADGISSRRTAIYDRLYGQMLFPPVFDCFIDSPQVQRLRDLKQLGNAHYIYPGATNTRFEHSLGTAHLAMEFLKQIYANHQEEPDYVLPSADGSSMATAPRDPVCDMLNSEYDSAMKDLWCVGIAGLCHDLGHGPLSHMFEIYVNKIRDKTNRAHWHHEEASLSMVDAIWDANCEHLDARFKLNHQDLAFIKVCIEGIKPTEPWDETLYGRPAWKRFMTEIVANKRNGLDVDKLDYLRRDYMCCCGVSALPSLSRLFQGARALADDKGQYQIAYQEKLDDTIDAIFSERAHLHRIIYQHRVTCVMDAMTTDALMAAHDHFKLHDANGRAYHLSDCVDHPDVYVKTGDWILKAILNHPSEAMRRAKETLERIGTRTIYTSIRAFDGTRAAVVVPAESGAAKARSGCDTRTPERPARWSTTPPPTRRAGDDVEEEAHANDEDEALSRMSSELVSTPVPTAPVPPRRQSQMDKINDDDLTDYLRNHASLSHDLREDIRQWEASSGGLRALTRITAKVSKVASDMDPHKEPLTNVGFFHHRQIGSHPPHSKLCKCRYTTRVFPPLHPKVRHTVVSRMPLTPDNVEELSGVLNKLLTEEQQRSTRSFSQTPLRRAPSPNTAMPFLTSDWNPPQLSGVASSGTDPAPLDIISSPPVRDVIGQAAAALEAAKAVVVIEDADDDKDGNKAARDGHPVPSPHSFGMWGRRIPVDVDEGEESNEVDAHTRHPGDKRPRSRASSEKEATIKRRR